MVTNEGGAVSGVYGGFTQFLDTATAGQATLVSNGGLVSGAFGGFIDLLDETNAESATFISNPGEAAGAYAAYTLVQTSGNTGSSTFIANPASVPDAEGGWVETDYGTASGASFIANGATVANCQAGQIYAYGLGGYAAYRAKGGSGSGSEGGLIDIYNLPPSDQTVVIAEAGTNGGLGGNIVLEGEAPVDLPQFQVFGNGTLDLTLVTISSITIGSLSGSGSVLLAGHKLTVGSNNFDTAFSGVIQETGALTKTGTGTLTLTGANTYIGPTIVSAGTLRVSNNFGSGTGTGAVKLNAGTLGGKGTIAGGVTVGTGSGPGAFLAPAVGTNGQAMLTIQRALTFKADATYTCTFKAQGKARTDQAIANGVTINSGAMIALGGQIIGTLRQGVVLTVISNTSANPINGAFSNLPDGGIVTINGNNFQASYSGGDGNDLTLTVVP